MSSVTPETDHISEAADPITPTFGPMVNTPFISGAPVKGPTVKVPAAKAPAPKAPVANGHTSQVPLAPRSEASTRRTTGAELQRSLGAVAKRQLCTKNSRILIIDDESLNVRIVRKYLAEAGYNDFVTTSDSTEALDLIREEKPDCVLLDILMPEISGIDILHVMHLDPKLQSIPVIVLSAATDADVKHVCLDLGANDFLSKPVDPIELVARVRNTLLNKMYKDQITSHAEKLEDEVRMRTNELAASRKEIVHCLARAAEYRDDDTGHHVVRVGKYVAVIAEEMGLPRARVELLELAAQLHDVGKIGIPDSILHKPGKLDPEQYDIMRNHCKIGQDIIRPLEPQEATTLRTHSRLGASLLHVSSSPLLMLAARIAQTHHEWWNGSGYPLGLKGADIPIEGRMTAVADVFDALSTRRPYKAPFPREQCFAILEEGRGTHFDPEVLDAFFSRSEDIVEIQLRYMDAY
ncbi:MAG: response regulator [Planctomycetaceae bacterium]